VVLDLPVSSEFFKQDPHLDEVRSVMGLPLVLHDRIIGAMTVDSYSRNAYTQKHAARAMSFARIAAIAVEHARLYQSLRNDEAALRDAKRQLEMSNDHLRELSSSDAHTGLSNRRFFEEVFTLEWRRSVRSHAPLSVIMIDVDDFKLYNDHYGHPAGDEVLRSVAMALRNSLQRAGDMVARYGGEEFIALLPSTDLVSATQHAERLRWRVEQLAIEHLASRNGAAVVTISVGVATAFAREDCDRSSLLIAADQQLYVAKRQGRNRVSAAHLIAQPMPLRERTTDA
jgi:diguanylate cyclase (GGDEF)-like protein